MCKEIQIVPLIIVFAVGVLAGIGIYAIANEVTDFGSYCSIISPRKDTGEELGQKVRTAGSVANPSNYQQAMEQFEGYRIQFAPNCLPNPTSMTVKNGTKILLDNRSADGHEITIDGVPHRLWGYEFETVTMSSDKLPHTAIIDCRSGDDIAYNAVQILIQP